MSTSLWIICHEYTFAVRTSFQQCTEGDIDVTDTGIPVDIPGVLDHPPKPPGKNSTPVELVVFYQQRNDRRRMSMSTMYISNLSIHQQANIALKHT